ncbi:MAG: glycine--tRNA ligase subunit beta, partial [candidate division Zixibacteria bacterium]|nr:glycine--tRNA ligase subunit beta [candidate division Zixibacteria bacterium]NIW49306.1 glycine--tRNA ligase subunit beta [Gammaproteobacteria bacterium]NIX59085.1 glycine--tRNA ligase subunit beta [candidate division Zixibacteria bacterium]
NVAFDAEGKPTKAASGFAKSCGVSIENIEEKDGKLFYAAMQEGKPAEKLIPAVINETLSRLSIPRKMRWGDKSSEFIRPVHWIVLLFGNEVIEFEILGVPAGKK